MTSKEALEIINIAWSGRKDQKNYPNFDDINEALYTLKKGIERLEKLEEENASLHTKCESLQIENEIWKKAIENSNKAYDVLMQNSNIQFLNQNQEIFKLKKVIEIIKTKTIIIVAFKLSKDLDDYKRMTSFDNFTQEEYDLLKEYL